MIQWYGGLAAMLQGRERAGARPCGGAAPADVGAER